MTSNNLFINRQLLSPAFYRDLSSLLELDNESLSAIAEVTDVAGGSPGFQEAIALEASSSIPVRSALVHLRVVNNLIRLAHQAGLTPSEAARQISVAAQHLEKPIAIDDKKRAAIEAMLVAAPDAIPPADRLLDHGPRFGGMSAIWNVRVAEQNADEFIVVPVLSLSLEWFDGVGGSHEAFFQLSDPEWHAFLEGIANISAQRDHVGSVMGFGANAESEAAT